ncbi:MAG: LemA family protein [Acidobacteria bacterium]|nr:MAG: LemA family protein [Acidobacteriota bacterium]
MTITRRSAVQLVALAFVAAPLAGCSYNTFVGQEEAIKAQWAQVENQLQRRNDLIPNLVENYPQLKANEQFNRLMDELAGTENRLAVERMRYNEKVQEYDTSRRRFPANLTAKMFGFKEYPYFQAPPDAKTVPKVNFSKPS